MRFKASHFEILKGIVVISIIAMLFSCKNDIRTVTALSGTDSIPDLKAVSITVWQSDTGEVKSKFKAPLMERYESSNKPYTLFPKGLHIQFYNNDGAIQAELKADWARDWTKQKYIEFKGQVIFQNFEKGNKLETEELIWDQKKESISSEVKIKITTTNDVLFGTGLTADEDFNEYEILNLHGNIEVEDDNVKK